MVALFRVGDDGQAPGQDHCDRPVRVSEAPADLAALPSKKAAQAIKDKVKAKTHRSTRNQDLAELILSLNRMLRGWATYFRHGVSKAIFNMIDSFTWSQLMRWIRRKYAGKARLGMAEFKRRFCDRGWRIAHQGTTLKGASPVKIERYRYRGAKIPTPWTTEPAGT